MSIFDDIIAGKYERYVGHNVRLNFRKGEQPAFTEFGTAQPITVSATVGKLLTVIHRDRMVLISNSQGNQWYYMRVIESIELLPEGVFVS